MVKTLSNLRVKLFADGADLGDMLHMYANPLIRGFTTNPTLMRKAGVRHYETFARQVLQAIPDRPISFEVFADDFDDMEAQAVEIASWGKNVTVKIPVTNTRQEFAGSVIERLSQQGVVVNVTAVMSVDQVRKLVDVLDPQTPALVSLFAGRVADTDRDPMPVMAESLEILRALPRTELVWASPREVLNVFQADAVGCHIVTLTNVLLRKLSLVGKDLDAFSLETVKMFYDDARAAGYSLAGYKRPVAEPVQ